MAVVYLRSRRTAFARDGNPALKCNPDGHIRGNTFGEGLAWEQWRLHLNVDDDGSLVALQSWTGKFLSALPDGEVKADCDDIGDWQKWRIVPRGGSPYVALQSHHGKYLVCDDCHNCGDSVRANREEIKEWEEWAIVNNPHALTNPGHTLRCAVGGAMIGVGIVATLGALAIPLAGIGVEGVAAGSMAATAQSAFCGAATSGIFSVLQSAGATLAWVPVAAGGVAASGSGAAVLCGDSFK